RGLAAAAFADNGQGFAGFEGETDIVERDQFPRRTEQAPTQSIDLGEVFDGEKRAHAMASARVLVSRWQRATWSPGRLVRAGRVSAQGSKAKGQRLVKAQPCGRSLGEGTLPLMGDSLSRSALRCRRGTEFISAWV